MPARKIPEVVDVLADSPTAPAAPAAPPRDTQDADATRARELEAQRAREAQEARLRDEEAVRIRELEDTLALAKGRQDPVPELEAAPAGEDLIVIHFVDDGFTALGSVWYRGQELEFSPGTRVYQDTCNRHGQSWLDLRTDENAQIERFGRVMFRDGPWPGRGIEAIAEARYEPLRSTDGTTTATAPSEADVAKAIRDEKRRQRAAPRLPAAH